MQAPKPPVDPANAQMQHDAQLEQMKGQQAAQLQQVKSQAEAQSHALQLQQDAQAAEAQAQRDMQLEQWKQTMQARQIQHQNELEAQRSAQDAQLTAQIETQKQIHASQMKTAELEFNRWKAELEAGTKVTVAKISAKATMDSRLDAAEISAEDEITGELQPSAVDRLATMHGEAISRMEQLMQHIAKPKQLIRGPDGRAIGVQ